MDPAALVDERLLGEVVETVNGLVVREGLRATERLGRYLLETVFGGQRPKEEELGEHPSWRALAGSSELRVAPSTLWFSVRTVEQLEQLSEEVGRALSPTHHRHLIGVRDLRRKRRLARRAVAEGWSARKLAEVIRGPVEEAVSSSPPTPGEGLREVREGVDPEQWAVERLGEEPTRSLRRWQTTLRATHRALSHLWERLEEPP